MVYSRVCHESCIIMHYIWCIFIYYWSFITLYLHHIQFKKFRGSDRTTRRSMSFHVAPTFGLFATSGPEAKLLHLDRVPTGWPSSKICYFGWLGAKFLTHTHKILLDFVDSGCWLCLLCSCNTLIAWLGYKCWPKENLSQTSCVDMCGLTTCNFDRKLITPLPPWPRV